MFERLKNYFRASFPGLALRGTDEKRIQADVINAARALGKGVVTWSATEGARAILPTPKTIPDTTDPNAGMAIREPNTVFIVRDIESFPWEREPVLTRTVRDLLQYAGENGSTVIFTGPNFSAHPTFEKMVTVLDYALPGKNELMGVVNGILKSAGIDANGGYADAVRALSGLSIPEAENACALSIIETTEMDADGKIKKMGTLDAAIIQREKIAQVKKGGALDYIPPDVRGMDAIGGWRGVKAYIKKRMKAFTDAARAFGLPFPKGLLVVGVAGCGKSLFAKIIGSAFNIPVLRLDVGKMKGPYVGQSGAALRSALALAGALAPCALWFDEIEKAFSGVGGGGKLDAGVSDDMLGALLTWMQERPNGAEAVYVIMTANDVSALPAPLMRAGRIDAIFSVDLPDADERAEIFQIHLRKRGRGALAETVNVNHPLIAATENFTGSEIETMVESGLFAAFDAGRELTADDIIDAAREFVPLIVTQREQIEQMREWAKTRAIPASGRRADTWTAQNVTETGRRMFATPEKN